MKERLLGFEVSHRKNKKYNAIIAKPDGRLGRVPFGDVRYQHYRDRTGIGAYSYLDHNNPKRRKLYLLRHAKDSQKLFSPGYFAARYLW